jgi:anti-sigma B factor antagonist
MEEQESLTRAQAEPVIVTLPPEIDMSNASAVRAQLAEPIEQGARLLIADLSATVFCDSSGMRNLLLAQISAAAGGAEMRVVVQSGAVSRVMEIMGLLTELRVFPTLDAAVAAGPPDG